MTEQDRRDALANDAAFSQGYAAGRAAGVRQGRREAFDECDQRMAPLQSRIAKLDRAIARAKELVKGSPVDWTDTPGSKEPDGWWKYTSQQNREIILAAVLAARESSDD